jgi:hypothetical protein
MIIVLPNIDKRTTRKPFVKVLLYHPIINKAVESPLECYGIIDTDADTTLLSVNIIEKLGLDPGESISQNDITGKTLISTVRKVELGFPGIHSGFNEFEVGRFYAGHTMPGEHHVQVLVGRDVLKNVRFTYDGSKGIMDIVWIGKI